MESDHLRTHLQQHASEGKPDLLPATAASGTQRISVRSLQIFECLARTGSTAKAAAELSVTQSAISHQMKQLSVALGERLFEKSGRTLRLTARGVLLARELTKAFINIGESVDAIIGRNRNRVRLAVCSSFGPGWLAPRISGFMALHPGIALDLLQYGADPDLTDAVADAFVTALTVVGGFEALDLFDESLIAVAAPSLMAGHARPHPAPLIAAAAPEQDRSGDWKNFFAMTGLAQTRWHNGQWIVCSHFLTALALAEAAAGIALVPEFLARRALDEGRLVQISSHTLLTGRTYRLCIKSIRAKEPALAALWNWFSAALQREHQAAAQ